MLVTCIYAVLLCHTCTLYVRQFWKIFGGDFKESFNGDFSRDQSRPQEQLWHEGVFVLHPIMPSEQTQGQRRCV